MTKYERSAPLFLFPEDEMHQKSFRLFSVLCYSFVEIIFKINTHVTKYTDILTFNFAHTINSKRHMVPL